MVIKLPDYEREQIICLLVIWTGYAESAFEKMDDAELMKEYRRRLGE